MEMVNRIGCSCPLSAVVNMGHRRVLQAAVGKASCQPASVRKEDLNPVMVLHNKMKSNSFISVHGREKLLSPTASETAARETPCAPLLEINHMPCSFPASCLPYLETFLMNCSAM